MKKIITGLIAICFSASVMAAPLFTQSPFKEKEAGPPISMAANIYATCDAGEVENTTMRFEVRYEHTDDTSRPGMVWLGLVSPEAVKYADLALKTGDLQIPKKILARSQAYFLDARGQWLSVTGEMNPSPFRSFNQMPSKVTVRFPQVYKGFSFSGGSEAVDSWFGVPPTTMLNYGIYIGHGIFSETTEDHIGRIDDAGKKSREQINATGDDAQRIADLKADTTMPEEQKLRMIATIERRAANKQAVAGKTNQIDLAAMSASMTKQAVQDNMSENGKIHKVVRVPEVDCKCANMVNPWEGKISIVNEEKVNYCCALMRRVGLSGDSEGYSFQVTEEQMSECRAALGVKAQGRSPQIRPIRRPVADGGG